MIIDVHGHLSAPNELYAWKAGDYISPNASFGHVSRPGSAL